MEKNTNMGKGLLICYQLPTYDPFLHLKYSIKTNISIPLSPVELESIYKITEINNDFTCTRAKIDDISDPNLIGLKNIICEIGYELLIELEIENSYLQHYDFCTHDVIPDMLCEDAGSGIFNVEDYRLKGWEIAKNKYSNIPDKFDEIDFSKNELIVDYSECDNTPDEDEPYPEGTIFDVSYQSCECIDKEAYIIWFKEQTQDFRAKRLGINIDELLNENFNFSICVKEICNEDLYTHIKHNWKL